MTPNSVYDLLASRKPSGRREGFASFEREINGVRFIGIVARVGRCRVKVIMSHGRVFRAEFKGTRFENHNRGVWVGSPPTDADRVEWKLLVADYLVD